MDVRVSIFKDTKEKVQLFNGQGVLEARGLLRHCGKLKFDIINLELKPQFSRCNR